MAAPGRKDVTSLVYSVYTLKSNGKGTHAQRIAAVKLTIRCGGPMQPSAHSALPFISPKSKLFVKLQKIIKIALISLLRMAQS